MAGWEAMKNGTPLGVVRRRRIAQQMINPPTMMIAIAPMTPPTIAPTDTCDAEETDGVDVDVGRGAPVTSGCPDESIM